MKKVLHTCLVFIVSIVSSNALFAGSWEGPANIETININGNGWQMTAIKLEGIVHDEPGCTGNQAVAVIEYSHPAYESFLSMALAAKMANKPIKLLVDGCESHGYPLIREMNLM